MARIRCIKPELPSDRDLASLPIEVRYTFLLLISQADDYGLVCAQSRQLLGALYPHDDAISEEVLHGWIVQLVENEFLRWRRTNDGAPVLEVRNWLKHQVVKNPGKPLLRDKLQELAVDSTESLTPSSVESTPILRHEKGDPGGAERERERERDIGKGSSAAEPTTANWVQEAVVMYAHHIGMLPHGRMGKTLKPAVQVWGWGGRHDNQVHEWFDAYCRHKPLMRANGTTPDVIGKGEPLIKNTQFCSPEDFVKNITLWRERCQRPAPDPKIIDARLPKAVPA